MLKRTGSIEESLCACVCACVSISVSVRVYVSVRVCVCGSLRQDAKEKFMTYTFICLCVKEKYYDMYIHMCACELKRTSSGKESLCEYVERCERF